MSLLPPLRLTGATILRDGELRLRSVALAAGRITRGPLPAADFAGYFILPGIVDLHAALPTAADPTQALVEADHAAARRGATTSWLVQGWSWEGGAHAPERAEALLGARARLRSATDLRIVLRAETHLVDDGARLLSAVRRWGVDQIVFSDGLDAAEALLRRDPAAFAAAARAAGRSAEAHAALLRTTAARSREVPRHLCRLAEAFDQLGVAYGSLADPSAERREHFSMIGARIAVAPACHAAAAAARAMNEPVLLDAAGVLAEDVTTLDLIAAGHCDALVSGPAGAPLAAAAFRLVDLGLRSLPEAWALIATRPAEILRLPDRGTLDHARRADLVIVAEDTQRVEGTIAAGRIAHLAGGAAERLRAALPAARAA